MQEIDEVFDEKVAGPLEGKTICEKLQQVLGDAIDPDADDAGAARATGLWGVKGSPVARPAGSGCVFLDLAHPLAGDHGTKANVRGNLLETNASMALDVILGQSQSQEDKVKYLADITWELLKKSNELLKNATKQVSNKTSTISTLTGDRSSYGKANVRAEVDAFAAAVRD